MVDLATVVFLAVGFLAGVALIGRAHPLRGVGREVGTLGPTTVIVPARNEAQRLPRLLQALGRAPSDGLEVIVVDDRSSDDTAQIARAAGAQVLTVDPPTGWTGKSWACHCGARAATGEVLVFLDADTEPTPEGLAALVATAQQGYLVSALPRQRIERPYERLSAGPALISVLGAGTGSPPRHPWWRRPVAYGPALALTAANYRRIGGHAVVRSSVIEDLALARAADQAGVPVVSALGGDLLGYRMYPEGVGSLVEGWSKNLAGGSSVIPPLRLAASILWVAAALHAASTGILALAAPGQGAARVAALVGYVAFAAQVGVVLRRIGRFGVLTTVLYPLILIGFVALFARSAVLTHVRRSVTWRGRQVPIGG